MLGGITVIACGLFTIYLLVVGLSLEDTYLLRGHATLGLITSIVTLFLLPNAIGLALPALLLQLAGLGLLSSLVWKQFCWRELRRYASQQFGAVLLRRAAMRARAAIRVDVAALIVHVAASYVLHDDVYTVTASAASAEGSPIAGKATALMETLSTLRGMSLHPAIPVLHILRSLSMLLLLERGLLPEPLRSRLKLRSPRGRLAAEATMQLFGWLCVWSSLMTIIGWFIYLSFVSEHFDVLVAQKMIGMGGNVGANNAAISAILLFVLASRTHARLASTEGCRAARVTQSHLDSAGHAEIHLVSDAESSCLGP